MRWVLFTGLLAILVACGGRYSATYLPPVTNQAMATISGSRTSAADPVTSLFGLLEYNGSVRVVAIDQQNIATGGLSPLSREAYPPVAITPGPHMVEVEAKFSNRHYEGSVQFIAQAGQHYTVMGRALADGPKIWLQDQAGNQLAIATTTRATMGVYVPGITR